MKKNSTTFINSLSKTIIILCLMLVTGGILLVAVYFPSVARNNFGEMSPTVSLTQKITLPVKLVLEQDDLVTSYLSLNEDCSFSVSDGDSVYQIAARLQEYGFVKNADALVDYMIYSGIDRQVQTGSFCIKNPSTAMQVANLLADPQGRMVTVVILPGWRIEEIGESIDAIGMKLKKEELLSLDKDPSALTFSCELGELKSLEGYLAPGEYLITRETTTSDFAQMAIDKLCEVMTPEILAQINESGFDFQKILIIASLIQREAQKYDEMPQIASVFLNRIKYGMKFESDPTVQYALGFKSDSRTWWKVPLTFDDLNIDSPYNTYIYSGYPPTPICTPSVEAIRSVLDAPTTEFLFFRAACDNSGYHQFSTTYDEHLSKECP